MVHTIMPPLSKSRQNPECIVTDHASLRRTHFNPRKKGRRSKGEEHEKRGGKGGGHWPPMNDLKDNWMKEIEEIVTDDSPSLPDENEADAEDDLENEQTSQVIISDYNELSPIGPNAVDFAGAGFDSTSPMSNAYSPAFANALNMNVTDVYCEGDFISQPAGMYSTSDVLYDGAQSYLPQAVAYDSMMIAPM